MRSERRPNAWHSPAAEKGRRLLFENQGSGDFEDAVMQAVVQ